MPILGIVIVVFDQHKSVDFFSLVAFPIVKEREEKFLPGERFEFHRLNIQIIGARTIPAVITSISAIIM